MTILEEMNRNILKLKDINQTEKLILLLVDAHSPLLPSFSLTSQEIAHELGLKRKEVLDALWALEERDYISCEISYRTRVTKLTPRFKDLISVKDMLKTTSIL